MATPTDLTPLRNARTAFRGARQTLIGALDGVGQTAAALADARRKYAEGRPELAQAVTANSTAIAVARAARTAEKTARANVLAAIGTWLAGVTVDDDVARLSTTLPLVLFPVRIETRFGTDPTLGNVLRVRIYPDEIFLNLHEQALTRDEYAAGVQYYTSRDAGGNEPELWRQITRQMPPERAAYVLRLLTPRFGGGTTTGGTGTYGASTGPEFPTNILFKPSDFSRPGEAVLPDRWVVRVVSGSVATDYRGAPIPEPLTMTPDPQQKDAAELFQIAGSNPALFVDDELAWTVDFARAQAVGMAVTIPLTAAQAAAGTGGFDRILVFGVKSTLDATETTTLLEQLFDAHHYTRGLAIVPQGTATNNTEDAPSPLPIDDPDGATSFAVERLNPPTITPLTSSTGRLLPAASDGEALANLLGVHDGLFFNVAGATGTEQTSSKNMARLLWPTTFGYFVEQLLNPLFSTTQHDQLRDYFINNVRGRGPAPAFRVGQVPYGVLPTLSLTQWRVRGASTAEGFENAARSTLLALRDTWRTAAISGVPIVSATSADPLGDLMKVLAIYPSARELRVRHASGQLTMLNLFNLLGLDFGTALAEARSIVSELLSRVNQPAWAAAQVAALIFNDQPARVAIPLVAATPSETQTVAPLFDALSGALTAPLLNETLSLDPALKNTVLYKLARQALLWVKVRAAMAAVKAAGNPFSIAFVELEVLVLASQPIPFGTLLLTPLGGTTPLGDSAPVVNDAEVSDTYKALAALRTVPTAELDRLFSETLDLASHRLDAWLTAHATRRLAEMRAPRGAIPVGCYLGGYAFVENVRPVARTTSTLAGYGTVEAQPGSGGYVQTPSLTHAAAASILRNGYLSYRNEGPNKYAFDLSSTRVRAAREVFEELRAGQPLGAVLGYQFERGLQQNQSGIAGLDAYRFALRNYYPLVANKAGGATTVPAATVPAVAARNVVDGLALWKAFHAGTIPFATAPDLPRPTILVGGVSQPNPAYVAVNAELARLDDAVDGVSDLNVGEGVLQLVKGNVTNSAGNLDALARGTRPPDPLMAVSQRGGVPTSHRVALVFPGPEPGAPAGWPAAATPRAAAEPTLDAWAGSILGDPTKVSAARVTLDPVKPTGTASSVDIAFASLGLRPLDVVAMARVATTPNAGSVLDRRIAAAAAATLVGDPEHRVGQIAYLPPTAQGASIPQVMEVARALGAVLGGARDLASDDLVTGVDAPAARAATEAANQALLADFVIRADTATGNLRNLAGDLASATGPALAANLVKASAYVADAFPAPGASVAALQASATAVVAELNRRIDAAVAAVTPVAASAGDVATEHAAELRAVFGADFLVLPPFVPPNAPELDLSLGARATLLPGTDDGTAPQRFLQQAAQIYDGLGRLRDLSLYMGVLGVPPLRLDVAQLPFTPGERWIGLPFDATHAPQPGRQSLLVYSTGTGAPSASATWRGLVVQDWVEVIPNTTEETGVAFNYDNPGAEAPQAVLVVAPSSTGAAWSASDVWATLGETLDLAKIRGVDLELVGGMGQFLPAIIAPQNLQGVAAGTSWFGQLFASP